MKTPKRIAAVLFALGFFLCVGLLLYRNRPIEPSKTEEDIAQSVMSASVESPASDSSEEPQEPQGPVNPVDFEALWEVNPDIYAWLYIPGTNINYPLVQREDNDTFYLNRNSQGKSDPQGALFSESAYNNREFTDPVTIIYGHYMRSGTMFGNLQQFYSSENGLEEYGEIYVYLPEEVQSYTPFAAVPYSSQHILYYTDFSDTMAYQDFLDQICSIRAIGANVDLEMEVTPEDQMLILSTCLKGNNQKRYLVLAVRTDDRPTTPEVAAGNS